MGCGSSKIEAEVAVRRCKARKHHMKRAVEQEHALASAYASYTNALRGTGAAIGQFADVEASKNLESTSRSAPQVLHTVSNLRPPPQPPEDPFLRRAPLPRAASLPPILLKDPLHSHLKDPLPTHPQALSEDEEEDDSDEGSEFSQQQHKPTKSEPYFGLLGDILVPGASAFGTEDFELNTAAAQTASRLEDNVELRHLRTQIPVLQTAAAEENNLGTDREVRKQPQMASVRKPGKSDKDFRTILHHLDEYFLKSGQAGRQVRQLLEAHGDYHHVPNVDQGYGIEEHNKKVSRILTWTRSSGSPLRSEETNGSHSDNINLASTLDRLHAWEKKLYDEVKAAESTKHELDRKSAQLKSQKQRGEAGASIERTKAVVKSLQTRYLVEFEAVDAAMSEVKKLRDDCLYNRLMNLLEALKRAWEAMFEFHKQQIPLAEELQVVEVTLAVQETNELCKKIINNLNSEVTSLQDSIDRMVTSEKECIEALQAWLHLNAQQIESDAVDNPATSRSLDIPVYDLCQKWANALKNLSSEGVLGSLRRFSDILQEMGRKQADEIKQKKRKEDLHRDLAKKKKDFEAFESKFKEKGRVREMVEGMQELSRHPVQEKRALIDLLEKSVAEEEQRHAKLCEENAGLILQSLKDGLPNVIQNMMVFSKMCDKEYGDLFASTKSSLKGQSVDGS